jgi:hypothetical protein
MEQDSPLLTELKELSLPPDNLSRLAESHFETYDDLFNLIRDESADIELRVTVCHIVGQLYKTIDKRRAVPPLLIALQSSHHLLRMTAARALGMLHARRATLPLIAIATDSALPENVRADAVYALEMIGDGRATATFVELIYDETAPMHVRTLALENSYKFNERDWLPDYLKLLSHPSPDMRFWAVFSFAQISNTRDYNAALEKLDEIVAYDHTLPVLWGWHVDREAILPLEQLYYRPYARFEDGYYFGEGTYLISPAPEYFTFVKEYRQWTESWEYANQPVPPIDLHLDPDWLKTELESAWQGITFNHRQLKAYLLDWTLQIEEKSIIGALHRDRYAVVLTGDYRLVQRFANWYRSIIAPEHPLYLYEWAGDGEALPVKIDDHS